MTLRTHSIQRKSWLASLGALETGKSFAIETFDRLYVDGNELVQNLVNKGAMMRSELENKQKAQDMFEDKITQLKSKFGIGKSDRDAQLDQLSAKVDALIDVVAALAQQKSAEAVAQKTAAKSTSTAKAPATKKPSTRKTTAKKPTTSTKASSANKPASKTSSAKKPATTTKPRTRKTTPKASDS